MPKNNPLILSNNLLLVVLLLGSMLFVQAQESGKITGRVTNQKGEALFPASMGVEGETIGTVTNENGYFELNIPAGKEFKLIVNFLGYENFEEMILLREGENRTLNISLKEDLTVLDDVEVFGISQRENTLVAINIKSIDQLPNSSGNIETLLKTMPGVASGNELSSQYSVRGGSFDENLIYVNDIEVHRPLLIQSAKQEGLSFVNPSMVSSIQFSSGGFDAEYGDKLSSVLDIRYKQPSEFAGSVSASFLGGTAHVEGSSDDNRFTHITGIRYKTTKFLLGTLEEKGDYNPSFSDAQTFLSWEINKNLDISFLGNYSANTFDFKPEVRKTNFGSLQQTLQLSVFYEGQEQDKFNTYMGAVAMNYHPNENLSLKFIGSGFQSDEQVTYDLLKEYELSQVVSSSNNRRDSVVNIGIGALLEHGRNYLNSKIASFEHKGSFFTENGTLKWGAKAQQELIEDEINEWRILDSSGYSLPYSNTDILFDYSYSSDHNIKTMRYSGFTQYTHTSDGFSLTLGARAQYWSYNKEVTFSPRGNLSYTPKNFANITWHLSSGMYHQPPFYKEIRDGEGNIYPNKKAQRSFHLVSGIDYKFKAWDRPFVFSSEIYYKQLTRVIPYKLDDVRLQYLPQFNAKGYAVGADFRVFGEFVPGEESWFSLSFLRTLEDVYKDVWQQPDGTVEYPGYYRRPTDQWLNFAFFFQDNLPSNPNFKVHLLLNYGSGLPYSGPLDDIPAQIFELGSYQRVDIGMSRLVVRNAESKLGIKSIWISFEVLNVLKNENKVSLDWVRTIESNSGVNLYAAAPNNLTGRIFNLKLSAKF